MRVAVKKNLFFFALQQNQIDSCIWMIIIETKVYTSIMVAEKKNWLEQGLCSSRKKKQHNNKSLRGKWNDRNKWTKIKRNVYSCIIIIIFDCISILCIIWATDRIDNLYFFVQLLFRHFILLFSNFNKLV